ncbi:DNA-binding protein [Staphylococcus aureus]|nr:DNA-binding protein [Staphylococcus aureus]
MLTKEFAQRVELSEKQVRKIVQHLEERGYQLSKTEYRGREATDFKEEDIELFKDIADKVKQTNSYDLAFDELEKEKASVEQSKNDKAAETSNKEATVDAEAQHDAEQQVAEAHAEASKQATSNDSLEAKAENDSTASQSEMSEPKPQEEKKGFFARLFNL